MPKIEDVIKQHQELVDDHLERYRRAVEESDACEVISYMSLLIYQHLEDTEQIEAFSALRNRDPATIAEDARRLIERELFASVDPDNARFPLRIILYAMREVDWLAVAEVILDDIAAQRMKARYLGDQHPKPPGIAAVVLGSDDPAPPVE